MGSPRSGNFGPDTRYIKLRSRPFCSGPRKRGHVGLDNPIAHSILMCVVDIGQPS